MRTQTQSVHGRIVVLMRNNQNVAYIEIAASKTRSGFWFLLFRFGSLWVALGAM